MPSRTPTTPKKTKKSTKSDPLTVAAELAALLLQRNPSKSVREVCRSVSESKGVNEETLRKRLVRAAQSKGRQHGLSKLTKEEEEILLGFILAFDQHSNPLSGTQIQQVVLNGFNQAVSPAWVSRFITRHKDVLTCRIVKQIESARLDQQDPEKIENWLERHERFMATHHFPAFARFNCDETRIVPPTLTKRVVGNSRGKKNQRRSKARCLGSLVPFVSAEGQVALSFYVIKDSKEANWKEVIPPDKRGRGTWKRRYAMTKSGCVNKVLWSNIMMDFAKEWRNQHPGLHCIVYVDNCSVHRSDKDLESLDANLVLKLAQLGIWLFFLPPNTTAWLQPLDNVAFGWLKKKLGQQHAQNCFAAALHSKQDGGIDLQDVFEVESTVFTPEVIKKSWVNTGMSQERDSRKLNIPLIRRHCEEAFGQPQTPTQRIRDISKNACARFLAQTPPPPVRQRQIFPLDSCLTFNADELSVKRDQHLAEKEKKAAEKKVRLQEVEMERKEREERKKQKESQKIQIQLEKTQKREAKRAEKEMATQAKLAIQCRKCSTTWRGGPAWLECEHCEEYLLCPKCLSHRRMMTVHEKSCKKGKN